MIASHCHIYDDDDDDNDDDDDYHYYYSIRLKEDKALEQ